MTEPALGPDYVRFQPYEEVCRRLLCDPEKLLAEIKAGIEELRASPPRSAPAEPATEPPAHVPTREMAALPAAPGGNDMTDVDGQPPGEAQR